MATVPLETVGSPSLRAYRIAIQVIGWLVVVGGALYGAAVCIDMVTAAGLREWLMRLLALTMSAEVVVFGIVALGLAQLIGLLSTDGENPGWVLRHGSKFLCLFAAVGLLTLGSRLAAIMASAPATPWYAFVTEVFYAVAKASILVGLALVLRRVLPVVRESKTLV